MCRFAARSSAAGSVGASCVALEAVHFERDWTTLVALRCPGFLFCHILPLHAPLRQRIATPPFWSFRGHAGCFSPGADVSCSAV